MRKITTPIVDRIVLMSMPEPNTGCWLWAMGSFKRGYGSICINGKSIGAHRASFSAYKGEIPSGMCVCHICDTPCCVNPDHLFLGTQEANVNDMMKKGRHSRGESNRSRLTANEAIAIKLSGDSTENVALKYGVSGMQVRRIKRGVSWKHLSA
jgi:hypothetical protein